MLLLNVIKTKYFFLFLVLLMLKALWLLLELKNHLFFLFELMYFYRGTHGTSSVECPMEEEKSAVNAWVFNQDYEIPSGLRTYDARIEIPIPDDVDPGDYHFMIRLTDHVGWQQLRAMAVKIQ